MSRRYTAADGRRFGFAIGLAFLALAIVAHWRGHPGARIVFAALGASLLIGALVAPAMLRPIDSAWMRLAHIVSRVTTPIFLAVVYFVVITPVGLLRRRLGSNPLVRRADGDGFWIDRTRSPRGSLDRQF